MRVADYVAKFLVEKGITDIFMLSGHGAMYLNDGIAQQKEIKYYCARNEATAPLMAEAYARTKGSVGAVCVTNGPGACNAVSGLFEAWVDSAPIIIISGQVPTKHTTHYAGVPIRTFGTAEINIIPVVKNITKYAEIVTNPDSIRYHLQKAYHLAVSGRPGPVWLDIPMDVQCASINSANLEGFTPPPQQTTQDYSKYLNDCADSIMELLKNSKRPLIIAGNGIRQGNAVNKFKEMVDLLPAPVVFSRLGTDILPFSHSKNLGLAGIKGQRFCWSVMRSADMVLVLGSRLAVPFTGPDFNCFDLSAKVAMVDIDNAELEKPGIKIDLKINSDIKPIIGLLVEKLTETPIKERRKWLNYCQELKERYPILTPDMTKRNPIDLYYFMSRLDALSGIKNIFTTDAGSNYFVGGQVFRFEKGQREITSGAFAAMGLSIPLAIGASIASPSSQILAVTGDGSLELNIQELKTISYYNLPIKVFVINNGGYLSMRNWQDTFFEGRRIGSDDDTGTQILNLPKVAEAFELPYYNIMGSENVDGSIKQILETPGPQFIEVVCDPCQKIIEPTQMVDL